MKRSKGIGPNNLGASKSAVKNQNKGYGTVATKIGMGAEAITKQTKSQTDTFGPGGTDPNPKLYAGIVAEAQKKGGVAAFIDAEHAFDKSYAEKLGIDTENLLISQPDNGEQALEITEHLIRSNALDIICLLYTSPSPRDATLSRMPSSA